MIPCRACGQQFEPRIGHGRYCHDPDCERARARERRLKYLDRQRQRRREMPADTDAGEWVPDDALAALEARDYAALRRLAGVAPCGA